MPENNNSATGNNNRDYTVNLQYLKDASFESPSSPAIFASQSAEMPKMKVNIDVSVNKINDENGIYEVVLGGYAESVMDVGDQSKKAYVVEIKYAAVVSFQESVPEDRKRFVTMVDVPSQILPFMRQVLASLVREGGFAGIMIDPVDFKDLYAKHKQQQESDPDK